jgi:hypothetical protein
MNVSLIEVLMLIAGAFLGAMVLVARGARPVVRHFLVGLGILLASGPLGVVVTLALLPLWRWLEGSYGIESVGHSGPAEWCYVVSFLGCVLVLGSCYFINVARGQPKTHRTIIG